MEIEDGGTGKFVIDAGQRTRFPNDSPGPREIEVITSAGSVIRFTVQPGGEFTLLSEGDIATVNMTLLPLDTSLGIRAVDPDR